MYLFQIDIIGKVKAGPEEFGLENGLFRPSLEEEEDLEVSEDGKESETAIRRRDLHFLFDLVQRCWAEDALQRPDFSHIKSELRRINRRYARLGTR